MTQVWECRGPKGIAQHVRRPHPDHPNDPTKKVVLWIPKLTEHGWKRDDFLYAPGGWPVVGYRPVIVTEGEKDADAAHTRGLLAVGTCTGASGAPAVETLSWAQLAGRTVILWPDDDAPGAKHMRKVAANLAKLEPAPEVWIVDPKKLDMAEGVKGAGADDWRLAPDANPIETLQAASAPWEPAAEVVPEPDLLDPPGGR